jgi:hypothetical protein
MRLIRFHNVVTREREKEREREREREKCYNKLQAIVICELLAVVKLGRGIVIDLIIVKGTWKEFKLI